MKRGQMLAVTAIGSAALTTGVAPLRPGTVAGYEVDYFDWSDVPGLIAKVKRYVVLAPYPGGEDTPRTFNAGPTRTGLAMLVNSKMVSYQRMRRSPNEDWSAKADALAHKQLAAALRGDWATAGPNTVWVGEYDSVPACIEELD